jgi:hypothetical protein
MRTADGQLVGRSIVGSPVMGTWDRVKPFNAPWRASGSTTRPRWARPFLLIGSCGGIGRPRTEARPRDGNYRERLDTQRAVTEVQSTHSLDSLVIAGPNLAICTKLRIAANHTNPR